MKVRVATQVSIAGSAAEVFEYLRNTRCHYLWNPQLQLIDPLIKLKLGAVYESTGVLLGMQIRGINTVTVYEQNKKLQLRNTTGTLQYEVSYELAEQSTKTVLKCLTIVSTDNQAFAFAKPVLKLLARRELQSDLQALKIAVEQKLT